MGLLQEVFKIVSVDQSNAHHVGRVFRALYGEDFPARDVYQPDILWREIQAGKLTGALAMTETGEPVGYISFFTSAPNPRLWEAGNMLVIPAYAQTDIASELHRYYLNPSMCRFNLGDGIFSEAVCCHYFTQVGGNKAGMIDCGLELDQLDGRSFKDGKSNKTGMARVSCVLQFMELSDPTAEEYLPDPYSDILHRLSEPLRHRNFKPAIASLPLAGKTVAEEKYYDFAKTWKVAVGQLGGDWIAKVDEWLNEAQKRQVVSLQVTVNTACPSIGEAIGILRQKGFFFGGLAPRWFGTDGVLMQILFNSETEYDDTKLYSPMARELMTYIRADREAVSGN